MKTKHDKPPFPHQKLGDLGMLQSEEITREGNLPLQGTSCQRET